MATCGRCLIDTKLVRGEGHRPYDSPLTRLREARRLDLAREHARGLAAAGELEADRVEGWWSADGKHEIDLVGLAGRDVSFVGEAKWSQRAVRRDVLTRLDLHKQALPAPFLSPLRLLYGRTGCLEEVRSQRGVRCFSAADLHA